LIASSDLPTHAHNGAKARIIIKIKDKKNIGRPHLVFAPYEKCVCALQGSCCVLGSKDVREDGINQSGAGLGAASPVTKRTRDDEKRANKTKLLRVSDFRNPLFSCHREQKSMFDVIQSLAICPIGRNPSNLRVIG
jgi:hypothetical protein